MDIEHLKTMCSADTSEWLKELSEGICYEEVKERSIPSSANAVKTFKKVTTFEELEKMIVLVMMDLNLKL
jgi:hypothetical protein